MFCAIIVLHINGKVMAAFLIWNELFLFEMQDIQQ